VPTRAQPNKLPGIVDLKGEAVCMHSFLTPYT
jgi:hypothetical protein